LADALALRVGGPDCAHLVTTRFPTVAWQFAPTGTLAVGELSAADGAALLAALAPTAVAAEQRRRMNWRARSAACPWRSR